MKTFKIPEFYKSSIISKIKERNKIQDPKKKDFSPTLLDFGTVRFFIARHFGFCYGVENAIEISYRALEENPGKRIFLLSQMIHNPDVNKDLESRGIRFIMDTEGTQFVEWEALKPDDIVIIPAFGTTLETAEKLNDIGIKTYKYDTTCPFVEKVWKKSEKLGKENHTIIIHGKHNHEETRATFSHSKKNAPSLIIKDISEAKKLGAIILGDTDISKFHTIFKERYSDGFDVAKDLIKIGIVNQTTMLATETKEIAGFLKDVMLKKYGAENLEEHFADTRDTLCYATNDNQEATYGLLEQRADIAVVVGGYNSSNTSHIFELCEKKLPSYYISSANEILSEKLIRHYDHQNNNMIVTKNFLPDKRPVNIILTSGASCPDATVEEVLQKLISYFADNKRVAEVMEEFV